MEVICLEDAAFFAMIERIVGRMKEKTVPKTDKWLSGDETMRLLRISSKTTLQKLRDEGKIRFTQPEKKIILYDADSIAAYLHHGVKETF